MKLGTMDFSLWISLLLLVFFIFPLKSVSPEDPNDDDNEDESDNNSATDPTASVIAVNKTDSATGNSTNVVVVMSTMTTVQARPGGMEMAQSGQDGVKESQLETGVAVKVGVPVALLGLVSLLGIIRLVSSRQLKDRLLGLGRIFDKIPEKSIPVYAANGSSSGNVTSETFANQTYTVQIGHDNKQSENKPAAGCGYDNREQGIYLCNIPLQAETNFPYRPEYEEINVEVPSIYCNTTYQTINEGRLDSFYDDFARSHGHTTDMPQRKCGETAYDNTAI